MQRYILRRLLAAIPTLLLVSLLVFSMLRLLPGDVVLARIAESGLFGEGGVSEEQLDEMRAELGLDGPIHTQYVDWLSHAIRGDLGDSLWSGKSVTSEIKASVGVSIQIVIMGMAVAITLAIPLGVVSAVYQNTIIDYVARVFAITGLSIPDFWLATMLLLVLSLYVGWLPEFRWFPIWENPSKNLQALIFPSLIVGYRLSASSARMTRSTMLEVLREDYVRTARAKGLAERSVVLRHALRNALIPVITIMGSQISFLLGGTVIVETIFSLPGMGRLTLNAVLNRDYPVVQGTVMLMAFIFIFINLIVDLLYVVLDPRIRYS